MVVSIIGYANKYLAEFTFRYDGSYKFAEDNRWGFFPSVSLGYVLSEEDFFKSLFPSINYFKLRGSFGILGNDNVGDFKHRKLFALRNNFVAFGSTPQAENTLYNKNLYPMPDLTWEKCRTYNVGFELNAWKVN